MKRTQQERKAERFLEAETVKAAALWLFLVGLAGEVQATGRHREPQGEVSR